MKKIFLSLIVLLAFLAVCVGLVYIVKTLINFGIVYISPDFPLYFVIGLFFGFFWRAAYKIMFDDGIGDEED